MGASQSNQQIDDKEVKRLRLNLFWGRAIKLLSTFVVSLTCTAYYNSPFLKCPQILLFNIVEYRLSISTFPDKASGKKIRLPPSHEVKKA
jgi:hypothetical protein